ncbi:CopK family periplasmic copper-binding protein [Marinobacterium lutimaris]|uniref:Copper resistance protein K n=1 Tax=Marinobacterium lutimaris TaxID=568106 RepID=A0A1H6BEL0_9GAMM|nr:CopK family periplasmic copper-binding protein [Marinobacterium lutimaris]SEG59100.1 Copper resistance protein K [Marinobacterium lutimaris]
MIKQTLIAAGFALMSSAAFAGLQPVEHYALQDGGTLYVFDDGKMGVENEFGLVKSVEEGSTLTTTTGKEITMVGNEIARVRHIELLRNVD